MDGVYGRVPFPTCWCVGMIPEDVAGEMDRAYRQELSRGCPAALDDQRYARAVAEACVFWMILLCHWHPLPNLIEEDREWGPGTIRQRLLVRLAVAAGVTADAGHLTAIGEMAGVMAGVLHERWDADVAPLPALPGVPGDITARSGRQRGGNSGTHRTSTPGSPWIHIATPDSFHRHTGSARVQINGRIDCMNRRWIALTALVLVVVGGIAAVIAWDKPDDWGGRHDRVEVVRVVDDDAATTAGTGDTIVIERGRGFFPFGIFFIPLGFLFVFLIARAIFGRRVRRTVARRTAS